LTYFILYIFVVGVQWCIIDAAITQIICVMVICKH